MKRKLHGENESEPFYKKPCLNYQDTSRLDNEKTCSFHCERLKQQQAEYLSERTIISRQIYEATISGNISGEKMDSKELVKHLELLKELYIFYDLKWKECVRKSCIECFYKKMIF